MIIKTTTRAADPFAHQHNCTMLMLLLLILLFLSDCSYFYVHPTFLVVQPITYTYSHTNYLYFTLSPSFITKWFILNFCCSLFFTLLTLSSTQTGIAVPKTTIQTYCPAYLLPFLLIKYSFVFWNIAKQHALHNFPNMLSFFIQFSSPHHFSSPQIRYYIETTIIISLTIINNCKTSNITAL